MNSKYFSSRFLRTILIGESSLPLETKYFHTLTLVGSISFFIAFVLNYVISLNFFLVWGSLIMGLIAAVFYILSRVYKKTQHLLFPCAWFGLGIFIFLWFFNGGIEGGATYSYFILLGAYIIILNKKQSLYIISASFILIIILLYIDYNYPQWIIPFSTKEERYWDVGISVMITIMIYFFTNWIIFRNYKIINQLNVMTNNRLKKNIKEIHDEMKLASKIQTSFFPNKSGSFPNFEYLVRHRPVSGVGGDIYSLEEIRPGKIRVMIADATGHGIQAALVTMLIFSEYNHLKKIINTPAETLFQLNQIIINKYANLKIYFSCVIVDIETESGKFQFSSAGHIDQYLIPGEGEIIPLRRTGYLIGLKKQAEFKDSEFILKPKESLFLFTDGLTEEFNQEREAYGDQRLVSYLKENKGKFLDLFLNSLLEEASQFRKTREAEDDITIISLRRM